MPLSPDRLQSVTRDSDLDVRRCPGCDTPMGRSSQVGGAIQDGRVALTWHICRNCGLGSRDNLILMEEWLSTNRGNLVKIANWITGNPAAIEAYNYYRTIREQVGEWNTTEDVPEP